MIDNSLHAANPGTGVDAQGSANHPDAITIAQLAKTLLESTLLQAKFNQALMAGIQDLAVGVRQNQEIMQKFARDLDQRITSPTTDNPAWGRFAVPVGDDLLLTKVLNSFLMYVESADMSVTPHLVMDGSWEKIITDAFIARLKPGMRIVDVGANYGYYTLIAAGRIGGQGKVYAFEPNPRTFEVLKKNINVNWFGSIVHPYQLAALDSRKRVAFHALREFQGSSSLFVPELVPEAAPAPEQRPEVGTVPLDDVVQEKVDLIKIDAEGCEPLVFDGMQGLLDRSPGVTIFMEFNIPMISQSADPRSFLSRIRELGFQLHYFTPWNTLEPFEEEKALQFHLFNLLLERK